MTKAETAVAELTARVAELEAEVERYEKAWAVLQAWGLNLGVEFRCIAEGAGLDVG